MRCTQLFSFVSAVLYLNYSCGQNGGSGTKSGVQPWIWMKHLVPNNYSRYESPAKIAVNQKVIEPARVVCNISPLFVTRLSMKDMDFTVDLKIGIDWVDHRLNPPGVDVVGRSSLPLPGALFVKLWHPQVKFLNCKGSLANVIQQESENGELSTRTTFSKEKNQVIAVRVAYRNLLTFRCDLKFEAYPFDLQRCEMSLQIGHDMKDDIDLLLTEIPAEQWKNINVPPGFYLTHFNLTHCGEKEGTVGSSTTYFTRYKYVFAFQRIYAQHIMLIYIPSVLIVTLSWISFWLDVKNAAPRIALGLTSLLTLSTQFNSAQKDLPAVAAIKALDIWMFACMFTVFASLLEYAVVVFCDSKQPKPVELPRRVAPFQKEIKRQLPYGWAESQQQNTHAKRSCCIVPASRIDMIACFFFPLAFISFNFGYWSYFLFDIDHRFRFPANGDSIC